jgi:hypothetical protein
MWMEAHRICARDVLQKNNPYTNYCSKRSAIELGSKDNKKAVVLKVIKYWQRLWEMIRGCTKTAT